MTGIGVVAGSITAGSALFNQLGGRNAPAKEINKGRDSPRCSSNRMYSLSIHTRIRSLSPDSTSMHQPLRQELS
ncbi:hypothetical protein BDR05DRAFT_959151 [Suillus weaverae]|nr:hypothetical protein BDR05DRAFT_959151 [Suillus weaverae]